MNKEKLRSMKLRTYETICLTKVDMTEDKYNTLVKKVEDTVKKVGNGEVLNVDEWGNAKISYPIEKEGRARWTYIRFKSESAGVDELQRGFKLNEDVLRANTIRANEDGSDYTPIKDNLSKDLAELSKSRFRFMDSVNKKFRPAGKRPPFRERKNSTPSSADSAPGGSSES